MIPPALNFGFERATSMQSSVQPSDFQTGCPRGRQLAQTNRTRQQISQATR